MIDAFTFVYVASQYNPETMRSWLHILSAVPDSILCLLKNPPSGEPNLRQFVDDVNPAMNERIHFLEWEDRLVEHLTCSYFFLSYAYRFCIQYPIFVLYAVLSTIKLVIETFAMSCWTLGRITGTLQPWTPCMLVFQL